MSTDYSKLIDETANRMKYILLKTKNISISDMKIKSKPANMDIFNSALLALLSMDIADMKTNMTYNVGIVDDTIRLIPTNLASDTTLYRQMNPEEQEVFAVHLQHYLSELDQQKKKLQEEYEISLHEILQEITRKLGAFKAKSGNEYTFNVDVKEDEILQIIFNKLPYSHKLTVLKKLVGKMMTSIRLQDLEVKLESIIRNNIVFYNDIYTMHNKELYGFIIANENKLELWNYNHNKNEFQLDTGNQSRYLENVRRRPKEISKIYGFLTYESRELPPKFKILDKVSKGEKESVKGMVCGYVQPRLMEVYFNMLYPGVSFSTKGNTNKAAICNDLELGFMRKSLRDTSKIWFFTPEQHIIYTGGAN
jgi:hypothetical protein